MLATIFNENNGKIKRKMIDTSKITLKQFIEKMDCYTKNGLQILINGLGNGDVEIFIEKGERRSR